MTNPVYTSSFTVGVITAIPAPIKRTRWWWWCVGLVIF